MATSAIKKTVVLSDRTYRSNGLAPDPLGGSFGIAPRVTVAGEAGGPGPGAYPIKSSVGDTFHFSMKGREKFGSATGRSDDPACKTEPGPGAYPKAIEFLHSVERTPPRFSVPKAKRPGLHKSDRGTRAGPGMPLQASCGKQVETRKEQAPFTHFGTSVRKPLIEGGADAGPGEYGYEDGLGDMIDSRKKSSSRPTMKGVGRDKAAIGSRMAHTDDGPGPNEYHLQSANTATISSKARSAYAYGRAAPSVKMSGRTKFGDPFAKW